MDLINLEIVILLAHIYTNACYTHINLEIVILLAHIYTYAYYTHINLEIVILLAHISQVEKRLERVSKEGDC